MRSGRQRGRELSRGNPLPLIHLKLDALQFDLMFVVASLLPHRKTYHNTLVIISCFEQLDVMLLPIC